MQGRKTEVEVHTTNNIPVSLVFKFEGIEEVVQGQDIQDSLDAAYRIEWHPHAIAKRFERYLIDLHQKRKHNENYRL